MSETGHLEAVRKACAMYLKNSGLKFRTDSEDDFILGFEGGVQVVVMARELPTGNTVIKIQTLCVKGMRIDGDLGIFIAEENGKLAFGKLSLFPDRQEVRYEHILLGDYLNQAELELAVTLAAISTSQYDDRIKEKWGGKTSAEL